MPERDLNNSITEKLRWYFWEWSQDGDGGSGRAMHNIGINVCPTRPHLWNTLGIAK